MRELGRLSILFNEDSLKTDFTEILITEGEMDAMSLWQAGFKNVLGTTAGAGSFLPEWHEKLENIEQIYLCFDSDEAGQRGAFTVADKLGFERCKNILLPEGQDLNDYLKDHSEEDFVKLVAQAKKFKIPDVLSIDEVFQRYDERKLNNPDKDNIITEWSNINKHIKSFKPGNLVILSAIAKTGETTPTANPYPVGIANPRRMKECKNIRLSKKSSTRSDVKFSKEEYDLVIREYQRIKGVSLQGDEYKPVKQTIHVRTQATADYRPYAVAGKQSRVMD